MNDATSKPIVVNANAGTIDALTAMFRYATVLVAAVPVLFALLKAGDVVALYNYFQSNDGTALVAAAIAIGTAAYGVLKSRKRGGQVATVAADPRVPHNVAHTKE